MKYDTTSKIINVSSRLNTWFGRSSFVYALLIFLVISYLIVLPPAILVTLFGLKISSNYGPHFSSHGIFYVAAVGCVLAPIIETFIFQFSIIRIAKTTFGLSSFKAIILSSILFGLSHYYNIYYVFFAFLVGIVLSYAFIVRDFEGGKGFFMVLLLHALRNLVSLVVLYLGI